MDFWKKLAASFIAVVIALIPTWFFLLVRAVAAPEGFWQNFALLGLGAWILGGIQLLFLFFLCLFLYFLWED